MAGGDYNGITKACDEGFYDMYDNKKRLAICEPLCSSSWT